MRHASSHRGARLDEAPPEIAHAHPGVPALRVAVCVATMGRPDAVSTLLARLDRQTQRPFLVVLSAPSAQHLPDIAGMSGDVVTLFGPPGLCAQRNRCLDHVEALCDVVAFLDDDAVPAPDYVEEAGRAFQRHPDWRVTMGVLLADGARADALTVAQADALIAADEMENRDFERDHVGAYGCVMAIRASAIAGRRFDERLALYGWQEDIDFSARVSAGGRIVQTGRMRAVHLGLRGGRVSGVRLGYSQIANPLYLIAKGTMGARFGLRLIARNVLANLARSLRPEPHVDRRGRLRGNLIAARDLVAGRLSPERIVSL